MAATPAPPQDQPPAASDVGPFVIQTAATASLQVEPLRHGGGAHIVAIHGAALEYVAAQEMLDRVVYRRETGSGSGLWVSDLFGTNPQQISDNDDFDPSWSPEGELIAAGCEEGLSSGVVLMNADGTDRRRINDGILSPPLTPVFSPDGLMLAYASRDEFSHDIYSICIDGSNEIPETNTMDANEIDCAWAPSNYIYYAVKDEWGSDCIHRMDPDANSGSQVTHPDGAIDRDPAVRPQGGIAFSRHDGDQADIYVAHSGREQKFTFSSHNEVGPSYSTEGDFLAFTREESTSNIYVKETVPPYREYQVTGADADESNCDLGSPTLQTSRVLIGPDGADRGLDPPITPETAYGAVMAFDDSGYLNFVRIGVYSHHADELQVTPQSDAGSNVAAVKISAPYLVNIVQDAGPGETVERWPLSGEPSAALLMFDADTGKVSSVLALQDATLPAAAGPRTGPTFREEGDRTIVEGPFSAVYDSTGELVAEGDIGSVEVDVEAGTASVL